MNDEHHNYLKFCSVIVISVNILPSCTNISFVGVTNDMLRIGYVRPGNLDVVYVSS